MCGCQMHDVISGRYQLAASTISRSVNIFKDFVIYGLLEI